MLTIKLDRCDGCGDCVEVCPEGAIQLVGGLAQINSELCTECEVCVQACPSGAIKVARPIAVREEPAAAVAERPRPGALATLGGRILRSGTDYGETWWSSPAKTWRARMIVLKSSRELKLMRQAGRIVAQVHERFREVVRPGITTSELEKVASRIIEQEGAVPSFKGYRGFPASICTSINEEIVHGIPSPKRVLKEGDIISLDVGAIYKGYQGDAAITLPVGEVDEEVRRLLQVTQGALRAGIAQSHAGKRLGDISAAIQRHAEVNGFNVVREYTGHGIGQEMHEDPQIPNFGRPNRGPRLRPGMTFALEPMVMAGDWRTRTLSDGWTVVTADGSLSAHFEHTLAVTDGEPEILTRR